jgi:primosomal protein N' (replication factor Y) (superfamily II helicase)
MKTKSPSLYVVRVLPIVRGFRDCEATYFSSISFPSGSLVSVPFRKKERWAIVLTTNNLVEEKSEIKGADFRLRKIKPQKIRFAFSSHFLDAAQEIALHYASTPGEILSALVPSSILEDVSSLSVRENKHLKIEKPKRIYLQGSHMERSSRFITEVSKSFSKGFSVLILVPTVNDAKEVRVELEPHFGAYVFELSSRLTKKKQKEAWEKISKKKKPSVVVVTTSFLSVPQKNIGLCVILQSGSGLFETQKKPHIDGRVALEFLRKKHGASLLTSDILIPLRETYVRAKPKLDLLKIDARIELIDLANTPQTTEERLANTFTLLSKDLLKTTETFLSSGKNVFWFVSRRGLFPGTICRDCGREHVCPRCGSSLVLHTKKNATLKPDELLGDPNRFFLCHRCSHRENALVTCRNCNSWRLLPLGIGVEGVAEEARVLGFNPLVLSKDTTSTKKSIRDIVTKYGLSEEKGKLLIGTDLAIPALAHGVPFVGIVSIDSRLALPSYAAEESTLRTLLMLASLSHELCLIQTRRANHRIFRHRTGSNLNTFRAEEIELRKTFLYPPFGTLVEISFVAKKEIAEKRLESLLQDIKKFLTSSQESVLRFPLRGIKKADYYKATLVVRILDSPSLRNDLREYLLLLSPSITVRVDPENL